MIPCNYRVSDEWGVTKKLKGEELHFFFIIFLTPVGITIKLLFTSTSPIHHPGLPRFQSFRWPKRPTFETKSCNSYSQYSRCKAEETFHALLAIESRPATGALDKAPSSPDTEQHRYWRCIKRLTWLEFQHTVPNVLA